MTFEDSGSYFYGCVWNHVMMMFCHYFYFMGDVNYQMLKTFLKSSRFQLVIVQWCLRM